MNFVITLLTILEVIVCLLLSLLVLMQRPRQEGLGAAFGSGVTDQMFGAQTTNVLQKATVYFGVALFGLTFLLAILISRQDDRAKDKSTFVEPTDKVAAPTAPAAPAPATPPAPAKADQTAPAPATTAPAPAKPAESKPAENKAPAPAAPAPAKPAVSAPVPAPPAPAPKPTTSLPAPAAPAPAK